jgi:DUF4097 and DUF4098 domain-containing protein YvlB
MMKILLLILMLSGAYADYDVQESETIQKTLSVSGEVGETTFKLDNINGNIVITGTDGKAIELIVEKTIYAESKDKLKKGLAEVKLGIEESSDEIYVFNDYPNRNRRNKYHDEGYSFEFAYTIKVPRNMLLEINAVNCEKLTVSDYRGAVDISNVNGPVIIDGLVHSAKLKTVNGKINCTFLKSPKESSLFNSVNGDIAVALPKDTDATLKCSTMHGDIFSDFEVNTSQSTNKKSGHKNGHFNVQVGSSLKVDINDGGVELKMSTVNGDILIPIDNMENIK